MKCLFTKLIAFSAVVMLMASCKKDETKTMLGTTVGANLTASTTSPVLSKATATSTALTLTYTAPNYGYNAAVTNTLQVDVASDNFASPKETALNAGVLSTSYTAADFNNLLLALNLKTGVPAQVQVRVKSTLSATAGVVYSNVVTLTATPFALISYVYVPGAYQGWSPSTADSLQSSLGNGVYTGVINFAGSDQNFKITTARNWNTAYGDAGNGKVSTSGGNLLAPAAGYYTVTLDLNQNTITYAKANYFSVIGDAAQGWGTDVDMKFDNSIQMWTLTTPLVSTGAFKVRQNHDWGTSYGTVATPNGVDLTSSNGGNISIPVSGNYKLNFAVNSADASKATYTLVKQ
jgi:hypothetical protein